MTTAILNDTRRDDLFKLFSVLGAAEGDGKNSRPEAGRAAFLAAADRLITVDDVEKLFAQYEAAAAKKANKAPRNIVGLNAANSRASQVSKFGRFIHAGLLPFFGTANENTVALDMADRIHSAIDMLATTEKKNVMVYDKMVSCMRAQIKKVSDGHAAPLTDTEIALAIAPVAADKNELKEMERVRKSLYKLAKDWPDSAEHYTRAGDALTPRINFLSDEDKIKTFLVEASKLSPENRAAAIAAINPPTEQVAA